MRDWMRRRKAQSKVTEVTQVTGVTKVAGNAWVTKVKKVTGVTKVVGKRPMGAEAIFTLN